MRNAAVQGTRSRQEEEKELTQRAEKKKLNTETQRTRRSKWRGRKAGGQLESARLGSERLLEKRGAACCAPTEKLLEFFGEDGELELGFGQGLYNGGLGVFRGGVARRCHFADEEVLRAFEHFLFAEGERLAAAERNETLEDDGNFEEGPGAHALGILFEAVLPVVMRVEFAGFEEAKDFGGFCGANNGTKANGHGI